MALRSLPGESEHGCASRRWDQIEKQRRLTKRQRAVELFLNNEEPAMEHMAQTVANGSGVNVKPGRRAAMYVKEHGTFLKLAAHRLRQALANGLKEWMPWRDPLGCRRALEDLLVEDELLVFTAEPAESGLKLFASRPQMARHTRRRCRCVALCPAR